MMSKDEFIEKVKELADSKDFNNDEEQLHLVPEEQYSTFISAILDNYKIRSVFTSLGLITDIANALKIEGWEVTRAIGAFTHLHRKLKGEPNVSTYVANATEIINDCTSYQDLIFLREHLEFRITTLLESLKPTSTSFSESWLKKRCPACGYENHMYNSSCNTCGWKPFISAT